MTKRPAAKRFQRDASRFSERKRYEGIIARYLADCYATRSVARTSELALLLDASRPYLSKRIDELFGKSLGDMLRERQLEEAQRLLRVTSLALDEVAMASAFGHRSTLHRQFHAAFGVTPTEYRRKATDCDIRTKKRR